MSVQNLGKVANAFGDAKKTLDPSVDNIAEFIAEQIDGADIDKVVKSFSRLGVDDNTAFSIFSEMGMDASEAAFYVSQLNKESTSLGDTFKNLGKGISETFKGIGSAFLSFITNPVALAATAVAASVAAYAIYSYYNSFEKLSKDAIKSKEALSETTAELESLLSQKEANLSKIKDLSSTDGLAKANEAEIKSLEAQNALLQAQINLAKQKQELQAEEAAQAANTALTNINKYSGFTYAYDKASDNLIASFEQDKEMTILEKYIQDKNQLAELQSAYDATAQKVADYNKRIEEGEDLTNDADYNKQI
ncbi:MAG: hypothetical protein ACI3V5_09095 [Faecousia sp.]